MSCALTGKDTSGCIDLFLPDRRWQLYRQFPIGAQKEKETLMHVGLEEGVKRHSKSRSEGTKVSL